MKVRPNDLLASVVVFLVALPLCMGISIASGVPPALGIITGIVGGVIVGMISGAPLQVSGPAAGLTVLVFDIVNKYGIEGLGPIVLIAGLLQIAAGWMRVGQWFRAMSPAVIYGMLAGIGVLIFAGQFHVMLDDKPRSSGIQNLLSIPGAIFSGIFPIDGSSHELAALMGLTTIILLVAWDKLKRGRLRLVPGALVAVFSVATVAAIFQLPVQYIQVPSNLIDAIRLPGTGAAGMALVPAVLFSAAALAFIASAETLLSASAVDRMQDKYRTDYDRELAAQGVGNTICGLLGALPMTGVIVRSSTNVAAGAETRWAAVLHGVWLLLFLVLAPAVLRMIPTSALGAILVYTGYKLMDVRNIRQLAHYGRLPLAIYALTVITIVVTDLLTGVIAGIALSVAKLIYQVTHLTVRVETVGNRADVYLCGAATFVKLPKLAKTLESFPRGSVIHVHIEQLAYIDHACLDLMTNWRKQHEASGGAVVLEWDSLRSRYARIADSPALLRPAMAER
jgi:MFS superfamily sulfate permease-like transporter